MADGTQVLREYLISLGFRINSSESKKFDGTLIGITKQTTAAGAAVASLGGAAIEMAKDYASSMEKLFYASKRTGSTVKQIQAMEYAGEQIGISSAAMRKGIEGMANALRNDPSLNALLKTWGIKTDQDPASKMVDLFKVLRQMPSYQANGFLAKFQQDQDTFLAMAQNSGEFDELVKKRLAMSKRLGADEDEGAAAIHEWKNEWREIGGEIEALKGVIAHSLIEPMHQVSAITKGWLEDLGRAVVGAKGKSGWDAAEDIARAIAGNDPLKPGEQAARKPMGIVRGADHSFLGKGATDTLQSWRYKLLNWSKPGWAEAHGIFPPGGAGPTIPESDNVKPDLSGPFGITGKSRAEIESAISNYADAYGVPEDLLRAIIAVESGNGTNMTSPTGVQGLTQITKKNARRLGGDRNDPFDSIRMTAQMLKENSAGGRRSWDEAAWMYSGNGSSPLGSSPPGGDPRYLDKLHRSIEQHNHITVNGGDPAAIKKAVTGALATSNGNLTRELRSPLQ